MVGQESGAGTTLCRTVERRAGGTLGALLLPRLQTIENVTAEPM